MADRLVHPGYNYDVELSICLFDMATFFHDFCWVLEDVALTPWSKGPVSVDPKRVVLGYTTVHPYTNRADGMHFQRRYFYLFRKDVEPKERGVTDDRDYELFANPPEGAVETISIRIGFASYRATPAMFRSGKREQESPCDE